MRGWLAEMVVNSKRSICLITSNFGISNLRLQPWRYLYEVAMQLNRMSHPVTLIGDELLDIRDLTGIRVRHITSTRNPKWRANRDLVDTVRQVNADVILWHVGLTSFLYQNFELDVAKPAVGIFTSPLYRIKDLKHLSLRKLIAGYRTSALAVLGSLLPVPFLRKRISEASLNALVVQTSTTYHKLKECRLWPSPLFLIPPGVDKVWLQDCSRTSEELRQAWGYSKKDKIVVFFGPPTLLRGLPILLEAFKLAHRSDSSLRLLILSRKKDGEFVKKQFREGWRHNSKGVPTVRIIESSLSPYQLAVNVSACNLVALPFELVPSDAPLSLLEARALHIPVVTTNVACLPELAGEGAYLVHPGNPVALAQALLQAIREQRPPNEGFNPKSIKSSIVGWEQVGKAWSQLIQSL
jgi:glycosyltransferase involved in cell wall biosynthesis